MSKAVPSLSREKPEKLLPSMTFDTDVDELVLQIDGPILAIPATPEERTVMPSSLHRSILVCDKYITMYSCVTEL